MDKPIKTGKIIFSHGIHPAIALVCISEDGSLIDLNADTAWLEDALAQTSKQVISFSAKLKAAKEEELILRAILEERKEVDKNA